MTKNPASIMRQQGMRVIAVIPMVCDLAQKSYLTGFIGQQEDQ